MFFFALYFACDCDECNGGWVLDPTIVNVIALIVLAVYVVNVIRGSNDGIPSPNTKGSPFKQK